MARTQSCTCIGVFAVATAACTTTLDADALARSVQAELAAQGVTAHVICPAGVQARRGVLAECSAEVEGEGALPVAIEVVQPPDRIAVRPPPRLVTQRVEPAIRAALREHGIEARSIDCGDALVGPGEAMTCDVEGSDGRGYRWVAAVSADGRGRGTLEPR